MKSITYIIYMNIDFVNHRSRLYFHKMQGFHCTYDCNFCVLCTDGWMGLASSIPI